MAASDDTCDSFNRLFWHDSKLRAVHLLHSDDVDDLVLEVDLISGAERKHTPVTVVFEDAVFLICDIDVQGKRECSDDIGSATGYAVSDLKTRIKKGRLQDSSDALRGYFHFNCWLIPPGGCWT